MKRRILIVFMLLFFIIMISSSLSAYASSNKYDDANYIIRFKIQEKHWQTGQLYYTMNVYTGNAQKSAMFKDIDGVYKIVSYDWVYGYRSSDSKAYNYLNWSVHGSMQEGIMGLIKNLFVGNVWVNDTYIESVDIRIPVFKDEISAINYLETGSMENVEEYPPYSPAYLDNKFIYVPSEQIWIDKNLNENSLSHLWTHCVNNLSKTARYGCFIKPVDGGYRVYFMSNELSLEMLSYPAFGTWVKDYDVGVTSNVSFFAYKYRADGVMQFRSMEDLQYYIKTGILKNAFVTGDYSIDKDGNIKYDKEDIIGANKYRYNKNLVLKTLTYETNFASKLSDYAIDIRWNYEGDFDGAYPARLSLGIGVKGYTILGYKYNNIVQMNEGFVGDPICPRLDEKQYILTNYGDRVKQSLDYKGADINLKFDTEYVLARVWHTVIVDDVTIYEYGPMVAYYSDGTIKDLGNQIDFRDVDGSKSEQDIFDSIYDDVNTIDKADKLGMSASDLKNFVSDVLEGTNGNGFMALLKDFTSGLVPAYIWGIVGFALLLLLVAKLVGK